LFLTIKGAILLEIRRIQDQIQWLRWWRFRNQQGRVVVFHPEKLEVAELTPEAWQGLGCLCQSQKAMHLPIRATRLPKRSANF